MNRIIVSLVLFCATFVGQSRLSHAGIVVPPGLNSGDQYYLAFVTDGLRDATSSSIGDYNAFAQSQALLSPQLTGVGDGVLWKAIAGTESTTVVQNLGLVPGVPIFLLDGSEKVADVDSTGWIPTPLLSRLNLSQTLVRVAGYAWTGFTDTGDVSQFPLGVSTPEVGGPSATDDHWINSGILPATDNAHVFAISSLMTVPEPSSIALASLGAVCLAFAACRRAIRCTGRRNTKSIHSFADPMTSLDSPYHQL